MINVRRLRILKAVVDTGSVVGAAELLHYTPSAVSQHVTALERETGTVLFERVGRGVRPTDAATLLSEHAGRVLGAVEEAEHALDALRSGHIGRLRVAAFPTAGSSLVPSALASFRATHPHVSLELVVVEVDEAMQNLHRGATDVAVILQPAGESRLDDEFVGAHLFSDPFRVLLPRSHRLASRRSIDIASLAHERWIGVTSRPGFCQQAVDDACTQAGFHPNYALEADEYPTAQGFVAAGLGVALVPVLSLGASLHTGVVALKIRGAEPKRDVWVVTRSRIATQPLVRTMLSCLHASATEFAALDL